LLPIINFKNQLFLILSLIFFQLTTIFFALKINSLLLFLVPILIIFLYYLIVKPQISLLLIGFISIIKSFFIEQFEFFQMVDLTLLLIILIWLSLIFYFLKGELVIPSWSIKILISFFLFTIFITFSGLYSASPNYGWLKILRFSILSSTIFITPIIFLKNSKDSKSMLNYFKIISVMILAGMLMNLIFLFLSGELISYLIRVSILGANPIALSRTLAAIAAMVTVIGIRRKGFQQLLSLIILIPILLAIVSTGSRGPLVSYFLGMIIFTILFELKNFKFRSFFSISISILFVIILFNILPENLTSRFVNIAQGDNILSSAGFENVNTINSRLDFYLMSINTWISDFKTFAVGLGSGGFSSLFLWRDFRWYPHNIFLEILVEFGIIGIFLILTFMFFSIKQLITYKKYNYLSENSAVWISGTLVMFFSAQFSGDLNDNRILLMFLAISLSSINLDKNPELEKIV
tara:strand:- start:1391 stop:2782 length:1392 start_codon:yes stop_codon:yes gene_type:complete